MHEDATKRAELVQMKFVAAALLGVVTVIYVVATMFEEQNIWIGFIRATAEAAMVGAIADWFAVTALFRHFGVAVITRVTSFHFFIHYFTGKSGLFIAVCQSVSDNLFG